MNFQSLKKLLLLPAAFLCAAAVGSPEIRYDVDQFGPAVAMLSLHARADAVTTALSADGKIFRVHNPGGVFVDTSPVLFAPAGSIRAVDQLRGAAGVDLVVSFNAPMVVEGRDGGREVRFLFVSAKEAAGTTEAKPPAPGIDPVAERKITELRELVRELTLEVVDLKKKLGRCGK